MPEPSLGAACSIVGAVRTSLVRDLAVILAGGLALAFVYCGCDWHLEPSFVRWAQDLPSIAVKPSLVWLAEHLRIFSNAGEGLIQQVKHNVRGHATYLLGQHWDRCCWYYYWVVPFIKLSLPLLLLPVLVALVRPRALLNWACLVAAALFLLAPMYRVQLGIRLILPFVTLGIVGVAAATVLAWRETNSLWRRRLLSGGVLAGLFWTASSTLALWPHALCYANEAWGGPTQAYRWVSDTDYDWGQGLKDLVRWEHRHDIGSMDVWYFGTDPAVNGPSLHPIYLSHLPLRNSDDVLTLLRGHYVAVSTTLLYGGYGTDHEGHNRSVAFFLARKPAARTATFFIYDLTDPGDSEPAPVASTARLARP